MEVKVIPLEQLKPAPYNPRKDLKPEDPEFQKIVRSLQEFDLVEPIIWNEATGHTVGGHQRVKALQAMGRTEAHVVVVNLSERQEKILNVTLNRTKGRWDNDKLAALMQELNDVGAVDLKGLLEDYAHVDDVLAYQPPDPAEKKAEDSAPQTFEHSFQVPLEYQEDLRVFVEEEPKALEALSAAVINYIRMGV